MHFKEIADVYRSQESGDISFELVEEAVEPTAETDPSSRRSVNGALSSKGHLSDIKMSSAVGEVHLFTLLHCLFPRNASMKLSNGVSGASRVSQGL